MKTLQELYTEVMNSEELKNEFLTLKTPEDIVAFAAKYGCTATLDEIQKFFGEKVQAAGELSEDDLAQVAGGKGFDRVEATFSVLTAGIYCVVAVVDSVFSKNARCGTAIKSSGMLCVQNDADDRRYEYDQSHKQN